MGCTLGWRAYIELDKNSPTPRGGLGASRREPAAASGQMRSGTCVCAEIEAISLASEGGGGMRSLIGALAAGGRISSEADEGDELCVGSGSLTRCFGSAAGA
ncbi:MAG: hypothetical protein E6G96_13395 [Alphaproteobacteria bacterium]|nr:MAG: hypothetical protein E6G96_13395 [Alphaproteobacteria bacterium]